LSVIVQITTSLAAVFVGATVTYFVNVRERRRRHVEDLFNAAIAAVASAKAATMFINNVPADAGLDEGTAMTLALQLRSDGYRQLVERIADARSAISGVTPYRDDLAEFLEPIDAVVENSGEIIRRLKEGPSSPKG